MDILDVDQGEEEIEIQVIDLGPAGIIPPDAEFNTVRVLTQTVICTDGHLVINRLLGEYVTLILRSDVTTFEVMNWADPPYFSRLILDIYNEGSFIISWPDWIEWSRRRKPDVTQLGNDLIMLSKADETVKGNIGGMDYGPVP